jgi:hypothetical protein
VTSATQGAYDNAYIPAVYFGALFSAACAVELPALAAALRPAVAGAAWSAGKSESVVGSLRLYAFLGLGILSTHAVTRWLDPSHLVPSPEDRTSAWRFVAYLTEHGSDVFVPCHPYYNVLAGGSGHLHIMGVNDVYAWPHAITADPRRDSEIRDHFRASVEHSFEAHRWKLVIQDDCGTPALAGLKGNYRMVEDLALSGRSPHPLTGYPCSPRFVWIPRG